MYYSEDDFVTLLEISYFAFCRRKWALRFIDGLYQDNFYTIDGSLLHENVHDSEIIETRKDIFSVHGMYVHSYEIGVTGQCDLVEFYKNPDGVIIFGREGKWIPFPVEYKRSDSSFESSKLQLCGQAMCLEEMLSCHIDEGALFYFSTRHREKVIFTDEMRQKVIDIVKEMHQLKKKKYVPKVKKKKVCTFCSLYNLCLPEIFKTQSVEKYFKSYVE